MKSKLKFILPVLLVALGGAYKFVLAKPAAVAKPKIEGEVYVLPKEFLVNLEGGKFAKLGVALVFHHGFHAAPEVGGHGAPPAPPEGYGVLPQEPLVRAIITDELTAEDASMIMKRKKRHEMEEAILHRIEKETDVKAHEVHFTDIAVQ